MNLSIYATKCILGNKHKKQAFAKKTDLASLTSHVDKLDTHKLKTVLTDLSNETNVVDNDVVKD